MARQRLIGIDFGTTYSTVSILDERDRAITVPNASGDPKTRSAIYIGEHVPGGIAVGAEAERLAAEFPNNVVRNFKRHLGTSHTWTIDGHEYTSSQMLSYFFKTIKQDVLAQGSSIAGAVIAVPTHATDAQRKDTIAAAQSQGIHVLGLVDEPLAAALGGMLDPAIGLAYVELLPRTPTMVLDLGGGTFDLCVIKYVNDSIEVLRSLGDRELGGIDWDTKLEAVLSHKFMALPNRSSTLGGIRKRQLHEEVVAVKHALSATEATRARLWSAEDVDAIEVTRVEFEAATEELVERARILTLQMLESGRAGEVESVLLFGGSSKMPMFRRMVETLPGINNDHPRIVLDPLHSVAHGAAYYAGVLAGRIDEMLSVGGSSLRDKNVQSRTSLDLGIIVVNEAGSKVYHALIKSGTMLPTTASTTVGTIDADQRRVTLKVVQGQIEDGTKWSPSDQRHVILECQIDNLPSQLPAESPFDVEFSCDASGLVHVIANHRDSPLIATARRHGAASVDGHIVNASEEPDGVLTSHSHSTKVPRTITHSVVVADLARSQEIAGYLEEMLDVDATHSLQLNIKSLVSSALAQLNFNGSEIPSKFTGDGMIMAFPDAVKADEFSEQLQMEAALYNRGKSIELAKRHFRIGIYSGPLMLIPCTSTRGEVLYTEMSGTAIGRATRLEGSCNTGGVLVCEQTWAQLGVRQTLYGTVELISGKEHEEPIKAYRRKVVDRDPREG